MIGSDWIVGVVGALQFEVLADRIRTEYEIPVTFEQVNLMTARWLQAEASLLKKIVEENRGDIAEDTTRFRYFLPVTPGTSTGRRTTTRACRSSRPSSRSGREPATQR